MFRLVIFTVGAIIAMLALARGVPSQPEPVTKSDQAETVVAVAQSDGNDGDTEIKRDASGQFHLTAKVNGEDTVFLVDTGADAVTLTVKDAERLGVPIDRERFTPVAQTASGIGYGTRIHLDNIEVAGQDFEDVEALVIDGLNVNLLGQVLLRRMGKVELRGDTLLISRAS